MLNENINNEGQNSGAIVQRNDGNITIVAGIDEKRVREIYGEMYELARRDFTQDAYEYANQRVEKLEAQVLDKIQKNPKMLAAFADPAFQILLRNAQKTAMSTEREVDYELLSELLSNRVQHSHERKMCTGIAYAVDIIDKIDDDALCAQTLLHVIASTGPTTGSCMGGIRTLQELYKKLAVDLPKNNDWIYHLEILNCLRINTVSSMKKMEDFLEEKLNGYFCVGIQKDSDDYYKAVKLLNENKLMQLQLVGHELLEGFVRVPLVSKESIRNTKIITAISIQDGVQTRVLTQEEIEVVEAVLKLYSNDRDKKKIVRDNFFEIWNSDPIVKEITDWWNGIPVALNLTMVGKVISSSNANRLDNRVKKV